MMKKIKLEICTGTTCYLLGSAELIEILDNLPPVLSKKIEVKGVPCQQFCQNGLKPPFVSINGKVMGEMNSTKIISSLKEILRGGETC